MKRQRLFKIIAYGFLAVSVFLTQIAPAFAAETEAETEESITLNEGDVVGELSIEGNDAYYDISPTAELGEYDYVGSTSLHTQTTYTYITFTNQVGNAMDAYVPFSSFEASVPVNARLHVERGHTYSGQMTFYLHMNFPAITGDIYDYVYDYVMLSDFVQQSNYEGITASYYGFMNFGKQQTSGECSLVYVINFDNYKPSFTGTLNINSAVKLNGRIAVWDKVPESISKVPNVSITCTTSSDWAGEMYDYPTDAVLDNTGGLLQDQLNQNQQIAQEQEQKESQRHDDLLHGFDTSEQDKEQSDFDNELNDFHEQEENILQNAMGNIDDIDFDFDFNDLSDTFSLIRIIFEQYILSMGDFSTIITLTLTIAVALFAVGWFR